MAKQKNLADFNIPLDRDLRLAFNAKADKEFNNYQHALDAAMRAFLEMPGPVGDSRSIKLRALLDNIDWEKPEAAKIVDGIAQILKTLQRSA